MMWLPAFLRRSPGPRPIRVPRKGDRVWYRGASGTLPARVAAVRAGSDPPVVCLDVTFPEFAPRASRLEDTPHRDGTAEGDHWLWPE